MRLIFDLETDGLLDTVSIIHCIATVDIDTGEERSFVHPKYRVDCDGDLEDGLRHLEKATLLAGHNIVGYDLPVLDKLANWAPKCEVYDTLLAAQVLWADLKARDFSRRAKMAKFGKPSIPNKLIGRQSLEAWGHRLGIHKGEYGINRTDWSTFDQEMLRYCLQDVRVNLALFKLEETKAQSERCIRLEHDFAKIMAWQEEVGVAFDVNGAEDLAVRLRSEKAEIVDELSTLFPPRVIHYETPKKKIKKTREVPFNPTSRDQIAWHLGNKYGWVPSQLTKSGKPQVDDAVLSALDYPEAKKLARLFMIQKRLGQVADGQKAWLKLVKDDNRIHARVIATGTPHGRCSHISPNLAQVPAVGIEYGEECRSLFRASPGRVIVGSDASGMQLRCLAHFLAKYDDGEYVKVVTEGDPHEKNRVAAGLETRAEAKRFIYAYLFGAGDELIGEIVGGGRKEGKAIKDKFLKAIPALKDLLEGPKRKSTRTGGLIAKARKSKWIKGLDGRRVPVGSSHVALNYLLANAEAVLMKEATVTFWQWVHENAVNAHPILHVHDEFQVECFPEDAEKVGEMAVGAIQQAGRNFNFRCPLDGEYKIGATWAETH